MSCFVVYRPINCRHGLKHRPMNLAKLKIISESSFKRAKYSYVSNYTSIILTLTYLFECRAKNHISFR